MKKKFFRIFHPQGHPLTIPINSCSGVNIKNRNGDPKGMIVKCALAKFQAIWCGGFSLDSYRVCRIFRFARESFVIQVVDQ